VSRLSDLLAQVARADARLAEDLQSEIAVLQRRRPFGLNFERHMPESVELAGRPVRKGDKVRFLPERGTIAVVDERLWVVTGFIREDDVTLAQLTLVGATDNSEDAVRAVGDLVVIAEFRDPIYPGLVSVGRIERGGQTPFHSVINAENYHALEALLFTHEGRIDAIYIDPPYNTGSEWIYNDNYVAADDLYKHSKWLAFMERRLVLARRLLKPTGVIIVAIGDDEHHRLRMLMDQVFGIGNFISDVVWQGGRKNDSRYVSNGADYMLIYASDPVALTESGIRWRERKQGLDTALAQATNIWRRLSGKPHDANVEWRSWLKTQKAAGATTDAVNRYDRLEESSGRPINTYGNLTWPGGGGPRYDIRHPITGKVVKVPTRGWIYSDPARMDQAIANGRVWFGPDENTIPRGITYLDEMDSQVTLSVFAQDRKAASTRLRAILGDLRFPNPKDHEVLMRWLRLVAPSDAVLLDFFGGSGTTTEAVMRLNTEDGGTRQLILVTNNELSATDARRLRREGFRPGDPEWEAHGVFEYVAKPRIETVVTGTRPDGSTYSDGLEANVEFFTMTYESRLSVAHNRAFAQVAPLLWLRAGAQGRRIDLPTDTYAIADAYAVLFDLDAAKGFLAGVAASDSLRIAYIVTDDDRGFQMICTALPQHVDAIRLYESYLTNFTINVGGVS
jgi:adenine-specific DNA-methyltransferase